MPEVKKPNCEFHSKEKEDFDTVLIKITQEHTLFFETKVLIICLL
jgi:hypothetical protein